jgi:hypothetical protein
MAQYGIDAAFCSGFPALSVLAYLDPGTGSFALQLLLAGVFSGMYAIKLYWARFRDLVCRLSR